jgi:hypothetical protein
MRHHLLAAVLAFAALPAQAQLARSFSAATYTGVGGARLAADFDNLGEAYNLDAIGGYHLVPAMPWGRVSAELNISVTVAPGENSGPPQTTTTPGGGLIGGGGTTTTESGRFTQSQNDLQAFILNAQAVYRTPGRLYGLGTVGFGLTNTSIEEIEEAGRTGVTFGGGIGFRFGEETAAIELMYLRVSEELQTIGFRLIY